MAALRSTIDTRAGYVGILSGVAYGLAARLATSLDGLGGGFAVMTLGFIFVVPITVGYLTVRPMQSPSLATRAFTPWLACLLIVLGSMVAGLEGAICVIFASPVMLVLSSIGGFVAASDAGRARAGVPVAVMLPWAIVGLEANTRLPTRYTTTVTSIEIAAPVSVVWPLVVSVDTIRPGERHPALFTTIGFPKPIAATLSRPVSAACGPHHLTEGWCLENW